MPNQSVGPEWIRYQEPRGDAVIADGGSAPLWIKIYVGLVVITLPIDWFGPTGALMREFGAKPATLVLTLGGIIGLMYWRRLGNARMSMEFAVLVLFAAWLTLGFVAAAINFFLGWSGWSEFRNPLIQLIDQSLLIVSCGVAVVGNSRLIRAYPVTEIAAAYLPVAALIHLTFFALQAVGFMGDAAGFLSLFRAEQFSAVHRPTGLFSEPAYFGTFAGLYGTALLVLPNRLPRRMFCWGLAVALYLCAVSIGAKTFVVVVGAQAAYVIMRKTDSFMKRVLSIVMLAVVVLCAIYFIQQYSALDVQGNLSSADRLGSTWLAGDVAASGYGLTGIGIGQFHFFYRSEFAPDFLRYSREATLQMSPNATNRASTYNLYLRVLVEMGMAGFILLMAAFWKLWSVRLPSSMTYCSLLFAGAVGFLCTQDTYFYPPLTFAAALIVAYVERQRVASEKAVALHGQSRGSE